MTITSRVGDELDLPCPSWCSYQDASDEACHGDERRVPLTLEERRHPDGGQGWADAYLTVYAQRSRLDRRDAVNLGRNEDPTTRLTPDEARRLAEGLIAAADELDAEHASR